MKTYGNWISRERRLAARRSGGDDPITWKDRIDMFLGFVIIVFIMLILFVVMPYIMK